MSNIIPPTLPPGVDPSVRPRPVGLANLMAHIFVVREDGTLLNDGDAEWGPFQGPVPTVWVEFVVVNTGGDAGKFAVARQIASAQRAGSTDVVNETELVTLDAGSSLSWSYPISSAGIYRASLTADIHQDVTERDETDNAASFRFVLATAPG
jgi:hypothetical protein